MSINNINLTKVKVGLNSGFVNQGSNAIAIGNNAGCNTQGVNAIAIGVNAGQSNQHANSIAIGSNAGQSNQDDLSIAIGLFAGKETQKGIAIGYKSGEFNQGLDAVSYGSGAGNNNQGQQAIAIGAAAGRMNQGRNSIVIDASSSSGNYINGSAHKCYIRPLGTDMVSNPVQYNTTTFELYYNTSTRDSKKDIEDLQTDTQKVLELQARQYRYKDTDDQALQYGLIAEEVKEVLDAFATYDTPEHDKPVNINWNCLTVFLLEEVKKLRHELDELKLR
jgi:hypothetical protein